MAGAFLVAAIGLTLSAATFLLEVLKNRFRRDMKESEDQDQNVESETEAVVAPQSPSMANSCDVSDSVD